MAPAELMYHQLSLIEDDERLSALIVEYLQQYGLRVEVIARGDLAVAHIMEAQPDLVILDLMLPGLNGMEVCRRVRPLYRGPILMLTACDEDFDQVAGLELGADDYVVKPVQPRVLLARVRALLRRVAGGAASDSSARLDFGRLRIEPLSRQVWLDDAPLELTTQEYELLYLLARHAGKVLSRDEILGELTGGAYDGLDRSVDIRISRLRRLLEPHVESPIGIKTVRGQGYLFAADGWRR